MASLELAIISPGSRSKGLEGEEATDQREEDDSAAPDVHEGREVPPTLL